MNDKKMQAIAAFRDSIKFPLVAKVFADGQALADSHEVSIRVWMDILTPDLGNLSPVLLMEFYPREPLGGGKWLKPEKWVISYDRRTHMEVCEWQEWQPE